jgi:aryl-phospho-beta-D-glucosidase BglC (GH1 family)
LKGVGIIVETYKRSFYEKKNHLFFALLFFAASAFAQNVKPYAVDLNKFPAVSDDKGVTFDKATKTFTIKKENGRINLWLNNLNISDYNVIKVKYKVLCDYGFVFGLDYGNNKIEWYTRETYCPTYLNEMEIPLKKDEKKLIGVFFYGLFGIPFEKANGKFTVESITLENVSNPQKTDIFASNEPPVVDTAKNVTIDEKLDAWDFVKNIGAGLNSQIFQDYPIQLDMGYDIYPDYLSKPTKAQIHFIKESGLNAIRLQTNPGHGRMIDESYRLSPGYIKNIKQVVDWCIEEDMYVILCGPFAEYAINEDYKKRIERGASNFAAFYVNEKDKKESERFLKAVWEQYAKAFNNSYDEHLIFEPFNEPVDILHEHGWNPKDDCAICKKDYAILNEYNQLVLDTIRSTGGNNANRFVLINGLGARWDTITDKNFKLPKDKAKKKLIPTYHDYSMGGTAAGGNYTDYYKNSIKELISKRFAALDKAFFSKHIPVLVGEIGQSRRTPILERIKWIKDFTAEASKPNRSCALLLWNDSALVDDGRFFSGYFDSWKLKWNDEEFVNTFIYGAQGKEYPLSSDFIKKNEVKIPSIVGKNILKNPVEIKDWKPYKLPDGIFMRSVPAKYKIELEIEKTGSEPKFEFCCMDYLWKWKSFISDPGLKVTGGTKDGGNSLIVKSDKIILSIDEKVAQEIQESMELFLNGKDIIVRSMKVEE